MGARAQEIERGAIAGDWLAAVARARRGRGRVGGGGGGGGKRARGGEMGRRGEGRHATATAL